MKPKAAQVKRASDMMYLVENNMILKELPTDQTQNLKFK